MDRETLRKFFICGHQWTRELTSKYKGMSYRAQLSLCLKELHRQKKAGEHNLF